MRTPFVAFTGIAFGAFVSGCFNGPAAVAQRASFDLGCPVNEQDVTAIGRLQYGVTACGCRASYVYAGNGAFALNVVSGDECTVAVSAGGESR